VQVLPAGAIVLADRAAVSEVFKLADPTKVAVRTSNSIRIVDVASGAVLSTINTGSAQSVAVSPDGNYVYVGKYQSFSSGGAPEPVTKINVQTGVQSTIGEVRQPSGMAISGDGSTLYVTNYQDGTVSVINTSTGATTRISTGFQTNAIAVAAGKLFVGSIINDLRVVTLSTGMFNPVATGSRDPNGFVPTQYIAAGTGNAYVVDGYANSVAIVNGAGTAVVGNVALAARPSAIVTTATGDYAFVASRTAGTVSVIRAGTSSVVKTFAVGAQPVDVQLSPDGNTLYVATATGVEVYSVASVYANQM
jgi:YVTN family beta-propeller protein